jgi:hypothetical protein
VRCGRSVADPHDDPVVIEAVREFAERLVEFLDGPESVLPELHHAIMAYAEILRRHGGTPRGGSVKL